MSWLFENPALGQVVHLAEPRFRWDELAGEAVGTTELEVSLDQVPTCSFLAGLGRGDRLRHRHGAPEGGLGVVELRGSQIEQAESHLSRVEDFRDGDLVGCHDEEVLSENPRAVIMPAGGHRLTDGPENIAELLVGDRPAQVGRGALGAPRDLVEAGNRGVEQAPPERARRRGLAQLLLDSIDELVRAPSAPGSAAREPPGRWRRPLVRPPGPPASRRGTGHCSIDHRRATREPRWPRRRAPTRRSAFAAPISRALPGGRPPGQDRPAVEEPAQVVRQFQRGGVTTVGLLLQALQADRLEVAGRWPLELAGSERLLGRDLLERRERCRALERRAAGQHLVEDRTQGVDVGRRRDLVRQAADLFGAM